MSTINTQFRQYQIIAEEHWRDRCLAWREGFLFGVLIGVGIVAGAFLAAKDNGWLVV